MDISVHFKFAKIISIEHWKLAALAGNFITSKVELKLLHLCYLCVGISGDFHKTTG